jgi:hypothetical protein
MAAPRTPSPRRHCIKPSAAAVTRSGEIQAVMLLLVLAGRNSSRCHALRRNPSCDAVARASGPEQLSHRTLRRCRRICRKASALRTGTIVRHVRNATRSATINLDYPGTELELFATATNSKCYVAALVAPHIGETVLDVGAGIGDHVPFMFKHHLRDWVCIEPDEGLAARLVRRIADGELPVACRVIAGTLDKHDVPGAFNTVLYLDVLEHILEYRTELVKAASCLTVGGSLIVLAPAHQFRFSAFDKAIGHHRRYSASSLRALTSPECRLVTCKMLDAAGFFASLANRLLLRSAIPSAPQIAFWDKILVPASRWVDPLIGYHFGKNILARCIAAA